jgi:XTP/dITP diphosphohydrolase
MPERSLIVATRNGGKIMEFKKLVSGFDMEIRGLKDFDSIPPVEEDGKTFENNAYKKIFQNYNEKDTIAG